MHSNNDSGILIPKFLELMGKMDSRSFTIEENKIVTKTAIEEINRKSLLMNGKIVRVDA